MGEKGGMKVKVWGKEEREKRNLEREKDVTNERDRVTYKTS